MIYIDRDRLDSEGRPIRPTLDWYKLAATATTVATLEGARHQVNRAVYRHDSVLLALEELFHGKCAYCESDISDTDWEIEHYRPKKRVAERPDHPGYYWLAYDWQNLLPACKRCNQSRKDRPLWSSRQYAPTGGKRDQFPLEDETTRAMSHLDDIENEARLLLHPCSDRPEESLRYDIRGAILARENSAKGRASIGVFHLDRRRLEVRRRKRIKLVVGLLRIIGDQKAKGLGDAADEFRTVLEEDFLSDDCEYAGAARCVDLDPEAFGAPLS